MDELRKKIDELDKELIKLLKERMAVSAKVGAYKKEKKKSVYDPVREEKLFNKLKQMGDDNLSSEVIEAVYREIVSASRSLQKQKAIAFLGPKGSFTNEAGHKLFGSLSNMVAFSSIYSVFSAMQSDGIEYGVVPIENNTHGVVGETLDLLGNSDLLICKELIMPIRHQLCSRADDLLKVKRIYSKDVAFSQCQGFLRQSDLEHAEIIPVSSTSKAAQIVLDDDEAAAICSAMVSTVYDLPIMFKNIEDSKHNKTRFVVVGKEKAVSSGKDKTTILAETKDESGALLKLLEKFKAHGINMTKIESRPTKDKSKGFKSKFYIDFEGHIEDEKVKALMAEIESTKFLGSYPIG